METVTTIKRFLNIPYNMTVKKIYFEKTEQGKRINLIEIDVYIFLIKIINIKTER